MSKSTELLRLATELKSLADRIIECSQELDNKGEDYEDDDSPEYSGKTAAIGLMLRKKMGKD